MAQPIRPEVWQRGIEDNRKLPGYDIVLKYFKGSDPNLKSIANNKEARRVWDIVTTDYITDYDDRRLNGLNWLDQITGNPSTYNTDGRDGWGASAYGVFQEVHLTSKLYEMSRHRSMALRVFDEDQYSLQGYDEATGTTPWGTATQSNIIMPGQQLISTAEKLNIARKRWEDKVLAPDIAKYSLFAVINGHMSGRLIGKTAAYNDQVFDGHADHYQWVATPGMVQGVSTEPQFAPIHCIQWDDTNIPLMLNTITTTWDNLFIEQNNRIILMDPYYRFTLMSVLTGNGVPATEAAYNAVENGTFTKIMGWTFAFDIPSAYWPTIWVDDNLNVVHSDDTSNIMMSDKRINSVGPLTDASGNTLPWSLFHQLVEAGRMSELNWMRTDWDESTHTFVKRLANYPLGFPGYNGLDVGNVASATIPTDPSNPSGHDQNIAWWEDPSTATPGETITGVTKISDPVAIAYSPDFDPTFTAGARVTGTTYNVGGLFPSYPWTGPGAGYGLPPYGSTGYSTTATGPVFADKATLVKVCGLALYQNAAQASQQYSNMVTDQGRTRGKFTEMCYDVSYDAWVIEKDAAGIMPIVYVPPIAEFSIPVSVVSQPAQTIAANQSVTVSPAADAVFKTQEQEADI